MKELRFHPYYREMLVTTSEDSYNIFRPNLEPEEDEDGGEKEAVAESPGGWLASPPSPELTEYAPE